MNGYMVAPLGLTERQMLIYHCLYKKCNFDNMSVNVTTDQIITDIKIIDLSVKVVNGEIKKMLEKGYLKLVRKGNKGNCSVYEIVKINELESGNLTATNRQVKGSLKVSDSNTSSGKVATNRQVKGNLTAIPIKEKEKEKENNIYSSVINYLNDVAKSNFRASTQNTKSLINARIKDGYSEEDLKKVIECKSKEWIGTDMEKYLRPATLFGNKFEGYLNQANKKAPVAAGANGNKKYNYNSSICNNGTKNTQRVEIINNF